MNPGIRGLPTQFSQMPRGLLGAPTPIPMPDKYWHHEAIDWATRVSANGGTVSTTVLRAVSDFCAAIDRGSIRDRFLRLNLSAGGFLGSLVPLYRSYSYGGTVVGNATDTAVNLVSADYAETGSLAGWKGNGTNKYLNTTVLANSVALGNAHLSVYVATATTVAGFPTAIGALSTTPTGNSIQHCASSLVSNAYYQENTSGGNFAVSNPTGLMLCTSIALNDRRNYLNGAQSGATNTTTLTSSQPSIAYAVFANSRPAISNYSSARISSYSIGLGMTAAQVAAYNTALSAFRAALGRA
jgi:hypothetical protein